MRIGGGGSSDDRVNLGWRADGVVAGGMGRSLMGRIRGCWDAMTGIKEGRLGQTEVADSL